ncbi:MAG: peptidase [bacterium]
MKWLALGLGIASTVAIVQDWYPYTMFLSLPFCLIWAYCGWLRTEMQLKWVNLLFCALYGYGIAKYYLS